MSPAKTKKTVVKKPAAKKAVAKKPAVKSAVSKKPAAKKAVARKVAEISGLSARPKFKTTTTRSRRPSSRISIVSLDTADKKIPTGALHKPRTGQTARSLTRLLGLAQQIVRNSTADNANNFDVSKWLDEWIMLPQPALDGRKPVDMIDTDDGLAKVERILGALESGSYL